MSQAISQAALKNPVNKNAHCQPRRTAIQGTASGGTIAPTLEPELKMPVTSARSLRGNHSATVLIAAGKLADSPSPRAKRAIANPITDRTRAWLIAAKLQMAIAIA